jgi:hypothetical protein
MANGSNFILGANNTATLPTVLKGSVPGKPFTGNFRVETKKGGTAISGKAGGGSAIGVVGDADGKRGTGVFGQAEGIGVFGLAIVNADSKDGIGVFGDGGDWGVVGHGMKIGVEGRSGAKGGAAVTGIATGSALAGVFVGGVVVLGPLWVVGSKSAAVPHPDGSHRALYAIESPESWFEDLGRAQLKKGHAKIALDRDFRALVRTDDYHVFVTAEGDCRGLFVSRRTSSGFDVHECQGGSTDVAFSYRIVARRKDVRAPRLARVPLPERPAGAGVSRKRRGG